MIHFKSSSILAILLAIAVDLTAQETQTGKLTITVNNVRSDAGQVRISLFNSQKTFLKKSFHSEKKVASCKNCDFVFDHLPYGEYTFVIHHDENSNGKMDKNFLGIPVEGYVFSNNAKGVFGPPSYKECLFKFDMSGQKLAVTLNY